MKIDSDRVYLYSTHIDGSEAPFERYRELAYSALSGLDLPLPETGRVLLKPNATVLYPAEKRIITHPGFVAGIVDLLIEKGVVRERLLVADGQSGERPDRGFTWKNAGYADMLAERNVSVRILNDVEAKPVAVPGGVVYTHYPIAREVTDCSLFFNVPVAKCHNLGCTTLNVKNLMGILAKPERHLCREQEVDEPFREDLYRLTESGFSLHEERFYHKLCDLISALRSLNMPRLCIVDGLIGRDGTAFNEGENHPLGWTLIGRNEVHVDAVGTYLMGLDPLATPYLKFAAARGLGTNRVEGIEVVDLATGEVLSAKALQGLRSKQVLMPVSRCEGGYYRRFRADGSVVPWHIDRVNRQRKADGLEPIPLT